MRFQEITCLQFSSVLSFLAALGLVLQSIIPLAIPGTLLARAHYYKNELGKEMTLMIEEFKAKNPPNSEAAKKSVMGRLCYSVDEDGNAPSQGTCS